MVKPSFKRGALSIALVGIMAATLECVKLALASIPNVEAVTLFTALFAYVLGPLGVAASIVFVCIEPIICQSCSFPASLRIWMNCSVF